MARAPVRQIALSSQLQPQANPVDTSVRPAQSPLREFAESLSKINQPLQDYFEVKNRQQSEDDKLRGEAAFYNDHSSEMAEAVRSGKIPPQYSPAFVEGFKQAQGYVAGGELQQKFDAEFNSWEGKNSDDEAAYDGFLQDFLKRNINTDDPRVLAGLLPQVRQLQANGRQRYIAYKAEQTYNGSLDTNVAGSMQDVDTISQEGLTSKTGTDYTAMWSSLMGRRKAFVDAGGKPEDFDKSIVEGMSAKILEVKDPKLLDFFEQTIPGTDRKYSDVPDFLKIKNATINNLESIAHSQLANEAQKLKKEQDRLKDEAQSGIIASIIADPAAPINEQLLQQAERNGDPLVRTKIAEWRKNLAAGNKDPEALRNLTARMIANPERAQKYVTEALETGVLASNEDLSTAFKFAESLKTNSDRIKTVLTGQASTEIESAIKRRTAARNDFGDPITGTSNEGFEALYDYRNLMSNWLISNPDATAMEIEEQQAKFGKMITDRFQLPEGGSDLLDPQTYERDQSLGFDNPYTSPQATDGTDTTGEQEAAPQAEPQADTGEAQRLYDGLTPEQKTQIDGLAKQQGVSPVEQMQRILKANPSVKPISYNPDDPDLGEGDQREGGLTPEKAESFITEAFAAGNEGPQGATNLKGLVRQAESGGDYNKVFGMGSVQSLTSMTVDQVLAQQQRAREMGNPSTAVGAYQFIYKTLRGLKSELGLKGTEKFTPELQEKMADTLLNRRGLQEFQAGRISQRQFALRLSQEFAALPNPNTGRSFYAGDGLNASRVPVRNVYQAMGFQPAVQAGGISQVSLGALDTNSSPMEIARAFLGSSEGKDAGVLSSFIENTAGQKLDPRELAWCAAFVNGVLGASGGKGTGSLMARSFLQWGDPVETSGAQEGDVVVLSRGKSQTYGHVGFYAGTVVKGGKTYIRVLGGNQGKTGAVSEKEFPASQLLGIRRGKANVTNA